MPIPALARSLLYLFAAMTGQEATAFHCPPWSQPVWRQNFGLVPLIPYEGFDEDVDVDDDPAFVGTARLEEGFALSRAAMATVQDKHLHGVTNPANVGKAQDFLSYFWQNYCQDSAPPSDKSIEYTIRLLPSDTSKTTGDGDHGYVHYRALVLAMLNRADGVMSIVQDVMVQLGVTPTDMWREARDVNRSQTARTAKGDYDYNIPATSTRLESNDIQAALSIRLFGDNAVSSGGIMLPEYGKTVNCLLQRCHESLARSLRTVKKNSQRCRDKFDINIEVAIQQRTPDALREATRSLRDWRNYAQQSLECNEPPFLIREKRLQDLWEELGFEVNEVVWRKGRRPAKAKSASNIPSDAEMDAAYGFYVEEYCYGVRAMADLPIPGDLFHNHSYGIVDDYSDLGVDHLKDLSLDAIWSLMGLHGATQFPFAEPGSPSGPGSSATSSGQGNFRRAAIPFWHQAVGMLASVENGFTSRIGQHATPTLLCDEVGLGKTIQIIGVICLVRHYYEQQTLAPNQRLHEAPFIHVNGTPFFSGLETIPNLPSIIISPRTLGDQWMEEWEKFTQQGSFSVVRYSVEQGPLDTFFTNPKGDYLQAAGLDQSRASSVVILADISAVAIEAQRCFNPPPPGQKRKDAQIEQAKGNVAEFKSSVNIKGSLFGMRFRVAAVDECHNQRNCGHGQRGVQMIAHNSSMVIGATATPLFTNEQNPATLARLLQLPEMCGEKGVAHHKAMVESKQWRTKEWHLNSDQIIKKAALQEAHETAKAIGINTNSPAFANILKQSEEKYENEEQASILRMGYIAKDGVDRLRRVMCPMIIRRTSKSLDFQGNPILALPPLRTFTAWSPMKPEEREMQARINQEHLQRKSKRKSGKNSNRQDFGVIKWHNFLMDQKHGSLHILILEYRWREEDEGLEEGSLVKTIGWEWDKSNINSEASTRMLTVDQVVKHFWVGNPKAIVFREDGTIDEDAEVPDPVPCDDPRKFLIYVGYKVHRNLFGIMFKIKERNYICYDGSMDTQQRQTAVDKFTNDVDCRIMIISNVGATGLNLTAASIVIIVSPVWSAQETGQIMGRVNRPGQLRDTNVYNIVAPDGIDLALLGYANGKAGLSKDFFTSHQQLQKQYQILTLPEADEGEVILAKTDSRTVKPTNINARKRKAQDNLDNVDNDDQVECLGETSQSTRPKKQPKLSTGPKAAPHPKVASRKVPNVTPHERRSVVQAPPSSSRPVSTKLSMAGFTPYQDTNSAEEHQVATINNDTSVQGSATSSMCTKPVLPTPNDSQQVQAGKSQDHAKFVGLVSKKREGTNASSQALGGAPRQGSSNGIANKAGGGANRTGVFVPLKRKKGPALLPQVHSNMDANHQPTRSVNPAQVKCPVLPDQVNSQSKSGTAPVDPVPVKRTGLDVPTQLLGCHLPQKQPKGDTTKRTEAQSQAQSAGGSHAPTPLVQSAGAPSTWILAPTALDTTSPFKGMSGAPQLIQQPVAPPPSKTRQPQRPGQFVKSVRKPAVMGQLSEPSRPTQVTLGGAPFGAQQEKSVKQTAVRLPSSIISRNGKQVDQSK